VMVAALRTLHITLFSRVGRPAHRRTCPGCKLPSCQPSVQTSTAPPGFCSWKDFTCRGKTSLRAAHSAAGLEGMGVVHMACWGCILVVQS